MSSLEPGINDERLHQLVDEGARRSGLEKLRKDNFEEILDRLRSLVQKGSTLLDVGAAHGWFLEAAARRGFQATGVEPDAAVHQATVARGVPLRHGFFPDVLGESERFNTIVFNDVFEHIPNARATLLACREHLSAGGVLVLNLPSSDGFFYRLATLLLKVRLSGSYFDRLWQVGMPSPHLHYFNARNLEALAVQCGFKRLAAFSLPSLRMKGLYTRIAYAGGSWIRNVAVWAAVVVASPFVRAFKSDIVVVVLQKVDR
jgi:SAM-dependent methyltransferase